MRAQEVKLGLKVRVRSWAGREGVLGSADAYDSGGRPTRQDDNATVWVDGKAAGDKGWIPLRDVEVL